MYKFVLASKNDVEQIIFDVISSKYVVYHIGGSFHFMKDGKFVFYISNDDFCYSIELGYPGWQEASDLYSIGSGLFYFKDREMAQKIMNKYEIKRHRKSIKAETEEYGRVCKSVMLLRQDKHR